MSSELGTGCDEEKRGSVVVCSILVYANILFACTDSCPVTDFELRANFCLSYALGTCFFFMACPLRASFSIIIIDSLLGSSVLCVVCVVRGVS